MLAIDRDERCSLDQVIGLLRAVQGQLNDTSDKHIDIQYTERKQIQLVDRGNYRVELQNNEEDSTVLLTHHDVPKSNLAESDNDINIAGNE